jgi:hypothetical protein
MDSTHSISIFFSKDPINDNIFASSPSKEKSYEEDEKESPIFNMNDKN